MVYFYSAVQVWELLSRMTGNVEFKQSHTWLSTSLLLVSVVAAPMWRQIPRASQQGLWELLHSPCPPPSQAFQVSHFIQSYKTGLVLQSPSRTSSAVHMPFCQMPKILHKRFQDLDPDNKIISAYISLPAVGGFREVGDLSHCVVDWLFVAMKPWD